MQKTDVKAAPTPARRTTIFSRTHSLLRRITAILAILFCVSENTWGQAVIMNGNYYLTHNEAGTSVNSAAANSFNPNTCLWVYARRDYIRTANSSGTAIDNNNNYLQYSSLSLGTDWGNWYRGNNNENIYHRVNNWGYTYYYLRLNGTTWQINSTNSNNGVLYDVTITPQNTTSTSPTINGADVLTATGNSTYTAQGAAYRNGYTNYRFNNADHYYDANGNSFTGTPANANLGTTVWNLTPNNYATVNTSGVVNVSTLPESDITLTLTATIPVSGGVPAAPSGTTLTASKEITIQGTKPSAPIITVNGSSVTLSTEATGTTSIRYTTSGTNPTATTGTVYNGAIDLSSSATSPVTIKAVTVRNGNASDVSTQVVTLTLPEPTITINGEAKTATITSSVAGATIYYTTNGSTPSSTNGTQYTTGLTGLNYMTVIQAIAIKDGWNDSPVASETVTIPSGVSGGIVTLFDYEDHSWSYYSDASLPLKLRSLNPADVKITYNGNGTGTVQTNNNDNPSTWGADATTVKVGIDANASTFVYYETLERTDGRTAASVEAATGRCAYTTIANPFSVRPTYDSDNTSKYRGFYAWRVKSLSGGTIHSAATGGTSYGVGSIINAETEIYFAPSSEYGMEVEFEALWARAYVSTSGVTNKNLGVERNFYVITASATSEITAGSNPCTYTSIYPNGTTNGTTAANGVTVYKYGGFTAKADSKIEYIILRNNNSTINAAGYNFTIGRGVSGYNGGLCATNLYGLSANKTSDFHFNFASGSFTNLYFCGDGRTMSSGVLTSIIGCDYDRAMGDNSKLEVTSDIIAGHNGAGGSNNNEGADFLRCTVKSGDFDLGDYGGGVQFYLSLWGNTGSGTYGKKTMIIEGGIFSDISGGIDVEDTQVTAADMVEIRMKGGTVNGALYGAAQYAAAYGNRYIIITGGEVKGWVAGGANGTQTTGGKLTGDTYVYFGGRAKCDSKGSNTTMGSGNATGGNIFGAGSGNSGAASTATVGEVNNSTVVIADECYVERNVYGGGNYGSVSTGTGHKSDIYIKGGTVNGSVFGGSNNQKGQIVNINMTDGQVNTGIYGGSNANGTVAGPVTININGGQIGTSTTSANIHGGGYGSSTVVSGNIDLTVGIENATSGATIYGDVYGGSALGIVNGTSATNTYHTNVTLNKGTINGSLYGGALGNSNTQANVYGPVAVEVNGGQATNVFGGNNLNGSPQRAISVTINATDSVESGNAIGRVFGGGNQAAYSGTPDVNMNGGIVGTIFGGGNEAGVSGGDVAMTGGTVREGIYGGCNTSGQVGGNITVSITGGTIGVDENNKANVHGGGYGSSTSSTGNVTVTIDNTNSRPTIWGDVYGGSGFGNVNDAAADLTKVWLKNGTVHGDIYGGGLGDSSHPASVNGKVEVVVDGGTVTGRIFGCNNAAGAPQSTVKVDINGTDSPESGFALAAVYGGGNEAAYGGTPVLTIHNCDNSIEYVYGGGNAASVAATDVTIYGGDSIGTVFGGGNGLVSPANVTGNTNVKIYGGIIGRVFGGSNSQGTIGGQINVNINKDTEAGHSSCLMRIGEVYGGGNLAASNAGNVTIGCTGDNPANEGIGDVYGGANQADITGDIELNISGGIIKRVFGGNNTSGEISGKITVNVDWSGGCTNSLDYVYGGGNQAYYKPTTPGNYPEVNIIRATVKNDVYGGGLGQTAIVYSNPKVTIGDIAAGHTSYVSIVKGSVYGGGSAAMVGNTDQANVSTNNTTVIIQNTNSQVGQVFGGGKAAGVTGTTTVTIDAGLVKSGVYGGCDSEGTVGGNISVYLNGGTVGAADSRADVFGGGLGSATATGGHIGVTLGVTTVYGDIYGGSALGQVNGSTSHTTNLTINGTALHGTVYGGGKGSNEGVGTKAISNGNVVLNYNAVNTGLIDGIYGGANLNGNVKGNIQVFILANVGATGNSNTRRIFGGGLGAATETEGDIEVNIGTLDGSKVPEIYGEIYGGSALGDVNKNASNTTTVNFRNGTLHGNLYGGGLGDAINAAKVNGKVQVNIGASNQSNCVINLTGVSIYGCNNTNGSPQDDVEVHVYNTAHTTENAAGYTGANSTYAIDQVFGGGNQADYAPENGNENSTKVAKVYIHGCLNTIRRVFAGGNAAAAVGVACEIDGGRFDYVFGGGNGETLAADIGNGGTDLDVHGGKINNLFGGSNTSGTITGTMNVDVDSDGDCAQDMYIAEFFCGNNLAPINTNIVATIGCGTHFGDVYGGCNMADITGNVTLTIEGGRIDTVYAGSKGATPPANATEHQLDSVKADINGDVTLNIYGGTIINAFGGSNINGNITGAIHVNMDWSQAPGNCNDTKSVSNVYGGSNLAAYTPTTPGNYPEVNILHGTVTKSVYGGGKGASAIVTSNPVVTIGDDNENHYAVVTENVYGGGDAALVRGKTKVIYNDANSSSSVAKLFGGGNAAGVSDSATVILTAGKVTGGIYGGCNASGSIGNTATVRILGGYVGTSGAAASIYGGGLGQDTRINGNVEVSIGTSGANSGATIYGDVYGGSAKGLTNSNDAGNARNGSAKTDVNLNAGTIYGSIYGGGHGIDGAIANVWGPVVVTVDGGSVLPITGNPASIFGCNNLNGSPKDSVVVRIVSTAATQYDQGDTVYALNGVYGGGNQAHYEPATVNANYPKVTVSCDASINDVFGGGNAAAVPNTNVIIYGGDIKRVFAGGNGLSGAAHVGYKSKDTNPAADTHYGNGNTSTNIYGGTIRQIFAGSNANGVIHTNGTLNINKTGTCAMIIGEVYGGGNMAKGKASSISVGCTGDLTDAHNTTPQNIGTTLEGIGTIYGGANAADIGAAGDSSHITLTINSGMVGNVFGGNNTSGDIYGTIQVIINQTSDDCGWYVGNVFGGGNMASYAGTPTVTITAGQVSQNIYGGGNMAGVAGALVNMNGGTVKKAIYGGCNTSGTVAGPIAVNINNGTVGTNAANTSHEFGVFGGGFGSSTATTGNVTVTIGNGTSTPAIYGDIYGGSALGNVNADTAQISKVWLMSGSVHGSIYGGGLGNNTTQALVNGKVQVIIDGGTVTDKVFGCNNVNGTPKGQVTVTINSTDTPLSEVYGGGNMATYSPADGVVTTTNKSPKVIVNGCDNSIGVVYGGGNAADVPSTDVTIWGGTFNQIFGGGHGNKDAGTAANVNGDVLLTIHGGIIKEVFGGSNSKGNITGSSTVNVEKDGSCPMSIIDVYGGGNQAEGKAGKLNIGCGAVVTGNVYGGAKEADVNSDIYLQITGGSLHNVFGGNNIGGQISGTITVDIDKDDNCDAWHVDTVYGGGNIASYTAPNNKPDYPQVNIKNGTVSANVFGGGFGEDARVTGNPHVYMLGGIVNGNVYGGGEAAPVTGNPKITASNANSTAAILYGGGKGETAIVTGNDTVVVSAGQYGYVFGGGEAADQSGHVTVNILGGTIDNDVYGGGALANTNIGNVSGNTINPALYTTTVNLTGGTMKNVYGGGLGDNDTEAKVYGNVLVKLNEGVADNDKGASISDYLFGCNNLNGTPKGSATVHVFATQNSGLGSILTKNNSSYDMKAVYGGGNMAAYIPASDTASTHVIIDGCGKTSIEYVYGGGNAAPAPATDVKVYGTYKVSSIFGGGNGKDSITVDGVKQANPGADVGIYKVSETVYNATDPRLRYYDPGHEKGNDKYILYGDTTGTKIGTTNVTFYGGIVTHLFGGSNTKGDIIKKANVILGDENLMTCEFSIDDVYGGSNEAYMSGSSGIDMKCIDGMGEVYGGSRMADVSQDVVLTISGGHYDKVFGGNNISGRIFGSITVNIEQTGCLPIVIGELYGGGNQAPYSVFGYDGNTVLEQGTRLYHDPVINIISCDSIHKVFGGGLGATAKVVGNPTININMVKGWTNGDYRGGSDTQNDPYAAYINTKKVSDNIGVIDTVFGGGNEAIVVGETYVNVGTESTVTVRDVTKAVYDVISSQIDGIEDPEFAQGDGDAVTKDLTITVEGANITGNIYGGGNNANVTGGTHVQLGPGQ